MEKEEITNRSHKPGLNKGFAGLARELCEASEEHKKDLWASRKTEDGKQRAGVQHMAFGGCSGGWFDSDAAIHDLELLDGASGPPRCCRKTSSMGALETTQHIWSNLGCRPLNEVSPPAYTCIFYLDFLPQGCDVRSSREQGTHDDPARAHTAGGVGKSPVLF